MVKFTVDATKAAPNPGDLKISYESQGTVRNVSGLESSVITLLFAVQIFDQSRFDLGERQHGTRSANRLRFPPLCPRWNMG